MPYGSSFTPSTSQWMSPYSPYQTSYWNAFPSQATSSSTPWMAPQQTQMANTGALRQRYYNEYQTYQEQLAQQRAVEVQRWTPPAPATGRIPPNWYAMAESTPQAEAAFTQYVNTLAQRNAATLFAAAKTGHAGAMLKAKLKQMEGAASGVIARDWPGIENFYGMATVEEMLAAPTMPTVSNVPWTKEHMAEFMQAVTESGQQMLAKGFERATAIQWGGL